MVTSHRLDKIGLGTVRTSHVLTFGCVFYTNSIILKYQIPRVFFLQVFWMTKNKITVGCYVDAMVGPFCPIKTGAKLYVSITLI